MTLVLGLVLLLGAVAVLGRGLVRDATPTGLARSLATLEQRSPRGSQELVEEPEEPFADRVLAPLQARALQVGKRLTGADKAERIRHKLDLAGSPLDWSVDRVVGLKVLAAVMLPVVGVAYGVMVGASLLTLLLIAAGAGAVGFFAPDLYLYQRAYERSEAIRRTLADSVDLLTISVEAGLGFDAALQQVARKTDGPLADEFSRVLREIQLGKGRADSLKALSERSNVPDLKSFVGAMVQADAFGISIAQVLRVQTSEIRVKRRQYAEAKAQQVPVKIMVPLVICILPCLMAVIMGPAVISMLKAF
ncbi:type II secretion system F family protein [Nocardioides antri]|uniref:Type II secretion system F family protein n=1 Tax=Nocardioides antri TaxID=2607659 RepID=A0A5B1MAB8_9ACTN|nr:type II secretion system F family protein [Nocardioides antri]KAA1428949.1 type II secretion system F family protein [Nocardioides antri]